MQYRIDNRTGNKLSVLGFGCMRFPSNLGRVNKAKTEELILNAINGGVNYFDTAYLYFGSEEAIGEILEKHDLRKTIYLATKLPHSMCTSNTDFDMFFNEQKKRLRTDYIDYYFMHNFTDLEQWQRLCQLGIEEWISDKKRNEEIRQIGFSFHGSYDELVKLLDVYDWDFVQIQYNYLNENYQAGIKGLRYAADKGLPVFIMEPLLGGKLVEIPREGLDIFEKANPDSTPVSWALNWIWNQSEATVILSGMNEMSQLTENMNLAEESRPGMMTSSEQEVLHQVVEVLNKTYKIRCTGCNYCMPCPKKLNIPAYFAAYNSSYAIGWRTGVMQYMLSVGITSNTPSFINNCIQCGVCEKKCPQGIEIRKELKRVKRRLQIPGAKPVMSIVSRFIKKRA